MALKECVRALSMKSAHVNYRANSLTQVLRSCFTDRNACTVVRSHSSKPSLLLPHLLL